MAKSFFLGGDIIQTGGLSPPNYAYDHSVSYRRYRLAVTLVRHNNSHVRSHSVVP